MRKERTETSKEATAIACHDRLKALCTHAGFLLEALLVRVETEGCGDNCTDTTGALSTVDLRGT